MQDLQDTLETQIPFILSSSCHPVKNLQLLNICKVNLYIFPKIPIIILDFLLKLYYAAKCSRNEHSASGAAPSFLSSLNANLPHTNPLPLALSVLRPRERERVQSRLILADCGA